MKCFHFLLSFENFSSLLIKSSHQRCCIEKAVLKKIHNIHRKTPVFEPLFNKVSGLKACKFIKKRVQHMFSCEYWGILKKTYFEEHLRTTASVDNFKGFHLQCFDFMANTVGCISKLCFILSDFQNTAICNVNYQVLMLKVCTLRY